MLSSFLEKCVFETWNSNHGHATWLLPIPVEYSQMILTNLSRRIL